MPIDKKYSVSIEGLRFPRGTNAGIACTQDVHDSAAPSICSQVVSQNGASLLWHTQKKNLLVTVAVFNLPALKESSVKP